MNKFMQISTYTIYNKMVEIIKKQFTYVLYDDTSYAFSKHIIEGSIQLIQ